MKFVVYVFRAGNLPDVATIVLKTMHVNHIVLSYAYSYSYMLIHYLLQ